MTVLSENSFQGPYDEPDKRAATPVLAPDIRSHGSWRLFTDTLTILSLVGSGVLAISIALIYGGGLSRYFAILSIGPYVLVSGLVLAKLKTYAHARFGMANTITAIRAGMTSLIAGFLIEAEWLADPAMTPWVWGLVAAALLALVLDGVDGYVARRTGTNSDFGARYDMEVDAALILCLSILAFALGKADWWVILIGGMRYLFVAAQCADKRLRAKLDASLRRQAICVLQIVCLCIILMPVIEPPVSTLIAALALVALVYSFGRDISILARRATGSLSSAS